MASPIDQASSYRFGIALGDNLLGLWATTYDPSSTGFDAPVGSYVFQSNGDQWKKTGATTTDWTKIASGSGGFSPGRCIIVAVSGGDTTSIKTGCAQAAALSPAPSSTNPATVLVYPGTYDEDAFTVPDFCNLVAVGGLGSVQVNPNTSTDTLVTCGSYSELYGFQVRGCSGSGGIGIKSSGFQSLIRSCIVADCETGLHLAGSSSNIILQDVIISRSPGTTMSTGIKMDTGVDATLQAVTISGTPVSTITRGIHVVGGGNITLSSVPVAYCTTGLDIESCDLCIASAYSGTANTLALQIDGSTTSFQGNACGIRSCTNDISVLDSGVTGYYKGSANFEKIELGGATGFFIGIVAFEKGEEGHRFIGDTSFGSHYIGSRVSVGSGHSSVYEQFVFTNTNGEAGTWNDLTSDNNDPDTSITLFAGTGAGNCVYTGVTDHIFTSLLLQEVTTILNPGTGGVISEYWDGSAWSAFNIMTTQGKLQYGQQALTLTGDQNIYFGDTPGWAKKTLNGQNAYWARYRITAAITTSPVVGRIEHFDDTCVIERKGYIEYHGDAQPVRSIPLSNLEDITGFLSKDYSVNANTNTHLDVRNNARDYPRKDGSGGTFRIPEGLNTALPITFQLLFAPISTASGDVEIEMYMAEVSAETILNGSVTELGPKSDIVSVAGTSDKVYESSHEFDLPNVIPGDSFIWSIIRDATSGNADDTYNNDVYIVGWSLAGTFWRN